MDLNKILSHLGFKPEDYTIDGNDFTMTSRFETRERSHAVYDENGELVSEAVTEQVDVTPAKTSPEQLQVAHEEVQLKEVDIALLIAEYLKDKQVDPENDSINIADGLIHRWDFANVPQPRNQDLLDLISAVNDKVEQDEINASSLKYLADTDYMLLRELDGGTPMNPEVKQLRAEARNKIKR